MNYMKLEFENKILWVNLKHVVALEEDDKAAWLYLDELKPCVISLEQAQGVKEALGLE